jgi:hypothetical protein
VDDIPCLLNSQPPDGERLVESTIIHIDGEDPMYEQRVEKETDQFEPQGPWLPAGLPSLPGRVQRARVGPWYVVVDEIHGNGCRFTVDVWPEVDTDGRLVFDTEKTVLQWVDTATAYQVIREGRQASADSPEASEIADRALRIGDVFAVWLSAAERLDLALPPTADGTTPAHRGAKAADEEPPGGVMDVTGQARVATRAAVDAVGAGELTEEDLEQLGIPQSAVEDTPDSMSAAT